MRIFKIKYTVLNEKGYPVYYDGQYEGKNFTEISQMIESNFGTDKIIEMNIEEIS